MISLSSALSRVTFLRKNRTNCYKYHNSDVITFFIEFQIISIIESDTKQKYSRKKVK